MSEKDTYIGLDGWEPSEVLYPMRLATKRKPAWYFFLASEANPNRTKNKMAHVGKSHRVISTEVL